MHSLLDMADDANIGYVMDGEEHYLERLTVVAPSISAGGTGPHSDVVQQWFDFGLTSAMVPQPKRVRPWRRSAQVP